MSDITPSLRITEIFYSLQGESRSVGLPTVFIRLTGCPLRCQYCDTAYAFDHGEKIDIESILKTAACYSTQFITVTGGEPLAQKNCITLLNRLCDQYQHVSLETSGAMDISSVDPRTSIVLDLKTPGSGEMTRNLYQNIELLKPIDQIKFVICDRQDYDWAKFTMDRYQLASKVDEILFSPSYGQQNETDLAQWILQDRLNVRMQIQLHKLLWKDTKGR